MSVGDSLTTGVSPLDLIFCCMAFFNINCSRATVKPGSAHNSGSFNPASKFSIISPFIELYSFGKSIDTSRICPGEIRGHPIKPVLITFPFVRIKRTALYDVLLNKIA